MSQLIVGKFGVAQFCDAVSQACLVEVYGEVITMGLKAEHVHRHHLRNLPALFVLGQQFGILRIKQVGR